MSNLNIDNATLDELDNMIVLAKAEIVKRSNKDKKPVYVISDSGTNSVFKNLKDALTELESIVPDNIVYCESVNFSIRYVGSEYYNEQSDEWIEV